MAPGGRVNPLVRDTAAAHHLPAMATVLVVDDHDGFRARARAYLGTTGFEVVGEAIDGASAVAEAERLRPEIVLLDIQLPDIDGFDVARRILAAADPPKIVLISSREAADYAGASSRAGPRASSPSHA